MIRLRKINKEKVDPIPVTAVDKNKIKGYDIIPSLYCNIFICARKKSGKTNTLFKILKECSDKDTEIHIFSSTAYNDENMIYIREYFEKKKYNINFYTEIKDGKEDYLDSIMKNKKDNKEEVEEPVQYLCVYNENLENDKKKKKKKKKKIAPEIIFVFDDISSELKSSNINKLVKQHRHYKSKVIISSQEVIDLMPEARKQIDFWLLFGKHPDERLEMIYKSASLPISFEIFKTLYNDATKDKYNFLFIDVNDCIFRKNFNQEYSI